MSWPRWSKVARDLGVNKTRTALAAVALAVGSFAVGVVLSGRAILTREIAANFDGTRPPSVVLHLGGEGADRALSGRLERLAGVARAEARGLVEGRVEAGENEWLRTLLFAVEDFGAMQVSTFARESGQWPPGRGEALIERSAVPFLGKRAGDTIALQVPGGPRRELKVVGVVHDPAQSPGWVDGIGYLYVSRETMEWLGQRPALNELRVIATPDTDVAALSQRLKEGVESAERPVLSADVRRAARHPHADQMESLLFLFGAFGALALALGSVLVAGVADTLLRQQVRQIGSMKAVGATASQVAGLYLTQVLALASAALAISVPAAAAAGIAYARFVAATLNFNLNSAAIPPWVFAVELAVGLVVPLAAAAVPVLRGSRLTVRQAMADYGLGERAAAAVRTGPALRWLGRPALLSLRNAFRRRGRLALTLGVMAIGGATFMSALDVSASWAKTVDSIFKARRYDLQVVFSRPYPAQTVRSALAAVPGVRALETWGSAWATRGTYRMLVTAVPPRTEMVAYPVLEGRWLQPGDTDAIVINHELRQDAEADLKLGDAVTLEMNGRLAQWRVVGVVRELGARRRGQNVPAAAYVNLASFERATGLAGASTIAVIGAEQPGEASLRELSRRVEGALDAAGLQRTLVQPSTHRRKELLDHLVVIRNFLLAMAVLVSAIGGLALAMAMGVNVMERTRELGVMRAIGATTRAVTGIVVAEGMAVAAMSWVLALAASLPLAHVIGTFAGRIFVHADLEGTLSVGGLAAWLAVALAIGLVSSAVPAWSAARQSVAKSLRYE